MSKPKVFVVQEVPNRNIHPARSYGDLQVLLPHQDIIIDTETPIATLNRKLEGFSDRDFILLIGDPVAIALSAMVASSKNEGRVSFLKWDKKESQYYPVIADLKQSEGEQ